MGSDLVFWLQTSCNELSSDFHLLSEVRTRDLGLVNQHLGYFSAQFALAALEAEVLATA